MTDFAKVQAYAIKSAVIALAFADVTSYLVMKRTINAPVVASEELVDSIDHANPVRIHLEFAGLAGERLRTRAHGWSSARGLRRGLARHDGSIFSAYSIVKWRS